MSNPQSKQIFSVSQKYSEVFDILDKVDNKSEFICQAIIEKFHGLDAETDSKLEEKVRKILKDMICENNLFLVSGNPMVPTTVPVVSKEVVEETKVETKKEDDEDDDYFKSVLLNM